MADDTNKSKNRRPQNMNDVGANQLPGDISRILEKSGYESQRYVEAQNVLGETEEASQLVANNPLASSNRLIQKELERRSKATRFMQQYEEQGRLRTVSQVESGVNRYFGSVNGEVQRGLSTFGAQQMAVSAANRMSPEQLEQRIGASQNRMSGFESRIRDIAANRLVNQFGVEDEEARKEMSTLFGQAEREKQRQIRLTGAARIHKMQGVDPTSQYQSLVETLNSARQSTWANGAAVKAAANLGPEEFKQKQQQAISNLESAFEKLAAAGENASEELRNAAKAAQEEYRVLQEGGRQGGGGGGATGAGRFASRFGPYIDAATAVFGAAGQGIQQIGVNQTIAVKQNAAGLAGLENQKYAMYQSARGGDVASQMLLSQWRGAEGFGSGVKTLQNVATSSNMLSNVGSALMGGLKGAAGGAAAGAIAGAAGFGVGAIPGAIAGGIAGGIYGTVNAVTNITDVARGVSGDQAKIQATQAQMEAARQILAVPAAQLQGFRDFSTGMGTVTRSMGSQGGAFLRSLQGDDEATRLMKSRQGVPPNEGMLPDLAKAGLSPQQAVEMAQYGINNMGSTFDKSQIFLARNLEKSGVGSKEENMQRMGMLSEAGANNPGSSLTGVLEAAFGKSLDSAKSLTALVKNTSEMAASSLGTRAGFDVTNEAATILAAGIDKDQPNREAAVQRARTAAQAADAAVTDQGVSFTNMVKMSRIGKMTGFGGMDQIMATNLDPAMLARISKMSPEDQVTALQGQGIGDVNTKDVKGKVEKLRKAAAISVFGQGAIGLPGIDMEKLSEHILDPNYKFKGDELRDIGRMAKLGPHKFASAEDLIRSARGITAENDPNSKTSVDAAASGKGGSKELRDADELLTDGFSQLSEAAMSAAEQLGGAVSAMKKLVELQKLAKAEGGEKGEGEFADAAGKAAGGNWLSKPAKELSDAAGKWDAIANHLISAGIGQRPTSNTPIPRSEPDSKRGASPGGN